MLSSSTAKPELLRESQQVEPLRQEVSDAKTWYLFFLHTLILLDTVGTAKELYFNFTLQIHGKLAGLSGDLAILV